MSRNNKQQSAAERCAAAIAATLATLSSASHKFYESTGWGKAPEEMRGIYSLPELLAMQRKGEASAFTL